MSSKSIIWLGMIVGSTVGSFVPALWGSGVFSYSSLFFSALGGVVGIWLGFRLSR
ncbi:MAG: hypothetical protein HY093_01545 [Candidatus Liptonbacteria bacterium]|nr:hypothetical protein [Candidatus Liptonbacteria bacterium]